MTQNLNGCRIAILLTDGFEQIEMTSPREALEKAGAKCAILSLREGDVLGFKHHDKADRFKVDMLVSQADPTQFDGVLLPGGVINGDALRIDKDAQHFIQEIDHAGKPIAVICHGGWLLVSAGLVKGRNITSWPSLRDDLRNAGANWRDERVLRDRNWVSSRKPEDLSAFNEETVKLFTEVQPGKGKRAGQTDTRELRP